MIFDLFTCLGTFATLICVENIARREHTANLDSLLPTLNDAAGVSALSLLHLPGFALPSLQPSKIICFAQQ